MALTRPPGQSPGTPHNLPGQLTPFVGRTDELAEITRRLANPACRLLTLVGPGGIGKTRLAIQAGGELLANFAGGVYFVPLQPLESPNLLLPAIADTLNFSLSDPQNPQAQLARYLTDKQLLLILDNFEHLLAAVAELTGLLREAAGFKVLVTSREALNSQEEWLYPVDGLPYPADDRPEELESFSAVQLFVRCARRVRPGFSLAEELAGVAQICRLVEGTPLAIELAASWAKSLTCAEIAAEIRQNLGFLASRLWDVPSRHRSMKAVFNHSWQLLSPQEQAVFKQLAVFRGGFRREAAEQVAGASLVSLTALVDKSLLRWTPEGRYQIHELLRQYAEERLGASPEEAAARRNSHCAYYAGFLESRRAGILAGRQREVLAEISADLDNVRTAWQWAVDHGLTPQLQQAVTTLDLFYQMKSRYLEAAEMLENAAGRLERAEPTELRDRTLAEVLVCLGWYRIRLGHFQQARTLFVRSREMFQQLGAPHPTGNGTDPLVGLGTLANIEGDYAGAAELGEQAWRENEALGDQHNLMTAHYVLSNAAFAQGHYRDAQHHAQQAYTMAQALQERWTMAYYLSDLGNVARVSGDYALARQYFQAAYDLRKAFGDPEGMAVALNHQGEIAHLQQDYQTAESLFLQSLAIYREIGDRGGLAVTLNGLGRLACDRGDYQAAGGHLAEALQITTQIRFAPLALLVLVSVGELLLRVGRPALGVELLAFADHHPAAHLETRSRAQQLLAQYASRPDSDGVAEATQRGRSEDLETIALTAQAQLAALPAAAGQGSEATAEPGVAAISTLVEPLTEREMEVLRLIAEGLTNREIAERLSVVIGTVKAHNNNIYGKLGASNRVHALARARELGLL